jgi:hypothetical protein
MSDKCIGCHLDWCGISYHNINGITYSFCINWCAFDIVYPITLTLYEARNLIIEDVKNKMRANLWLIE